MKRQNAFKISGEFLDRKFTHISYDGEEVDLYGGDLVTLAQKYLAQEDDCKNRTSFKIQIASALKCEIDKILDEIFLAFKEVTSIVGGVAIEYDNN